MANVNPFYFFLNSSSLFYWPYLLSSILIACVLPLLSTKVAPLNKFNSEKALRSFVHDLLFFVVNSYLALFLLTPNLAVLMHGIESYVNDCLQGIFTNGFTLEGGHSIHWYYTFISVVAYDLAFFLVHLLAHKNRFIWRFHRVHHTAKILTPITVFRIHPFEMMFMAVITTASVALVYGVFKFFWPNQLTLVSVWGINGFLFLFYFTGYHLRHSAVWFSYGPILERILISPAQHQVHHSCKPVHRDKNMGLIFSVWDGLFGTLYITNKREQLEFGLTKKD